MLSVDVFGHTDHHRLSLPVRLLYVEPCLALSLLLAVISHWNMNQSCQSCLSKVMWLNRCMHNVLLLVLVLCIRSCHKGGEIWSFIYKGLNSSIFKCTIWNFLLIQRWSLVISWNSVQPWELFSSPPLLSLHLASPHQDEAKTLNKAVSCLKISFSLTLFGGHSTSQRGIWDICSW